MSAQQGTRSVDGKGVSDADALAAIPASLRPRQRVTVSITRPDTTSSTVSVMLGELPGG